MADVEFYFDFSTPWNYLAFLRLRDAAMRQSARIVWLPVSPGRFAQAHAAASATEARERYRQKDLADWARFCGVKLAPAAFQGGMAAGPALRGAATLVEHPAILAYVHAVFRCLFEQGHEVPDLAAVLALTRDIGPLPDGFSDQLGRPAPDALLDAHAGQLVRRGGFATPSFVVGDELFFGADRMPLVELALQERSDVRIVAPGAHGQQRASPGAGK